MSEGITFHLPKSEIELIVRETIKAIAPPRPVPLVMTKKQLAEFVVKPISTIDRWMKQGMPFRKEGDEYPEFYRPAVEAWLYERHSQKVQGQESNPEGQELFEGHVVVSQTS